MMIEQTPGRVWLGGILLATAMFATPAATAGEVIRAGAEGTLPFDQVITQRPALLLALSHHTLPLAEALPRAWIADGGTFPSPRIITLLAAAKAPWPVRHLLIPNHLEAARQERQTAFSARIPDIAAAPVVADLIGDTARDLHVDDLGARGWATLILTPDGQITPLARGEWVGDGEVAVIAREIAAAAKPRLQ